MAAQFVCDGTCSGDEHGDCSHDPKRPPCFVCGSRSTWIEATFSNRKRPARYLCAECAPEYASKDLRCTLRPVLDQKPESTEVLVAQLTKRLMRHFDKKHHQFLVDYGWEHVARVVLKIPVVRRKLSASR